jgi:hypothetical protein
MANNNRNTDDNELIERLKTQAAEAADGRMVVYESGDLRAREQERFWRQVVEFETGGTTDLWKELTAAGVDLPNPQSMDDETLHAALWATIEALGQIGVFLDQTNHLSDRELYTLLWQELLIEEMPSLDVDGNSAWHIDILGKCSDEDIVLYLKYYADEPTRQHWRVEFPAYDVPDHEDPPYDRDRDLPIAFREPSHGDLR